jgi:hypothetical protein
MRQVLCANIKEKEQKMKLSFVIKSKQGWFYLRVTRKVKELHSDFTKGARKKDLRSRYDGQRWKIQILVSHEYPVGFQSFCVFDRRS